MSKNEKYPMCHIYGQKDWHDEVLIAGNKEGLERLRDLIDLTLEHGFGKTDLWPKDMECYDVYMACVSEKELTDIEIPYSDEVCEEAGKVDKAFELLPNKIKQLD